MENNDDESAIIGRKAFDKALNPADKLNQRVEIERNQFEQFIGLRRMDRPQDGGFSRDLLTDGYIDQRLQFAWIAWQAVSESQGAEIKRLKSKQNTIDIDGLIVGENTVRYYREQIEQLQQTITSMIRFTRHDSQCRLTRWGVDEGEGELAVCDCGLSKLINHHCTLHG